MIIIRYGFLITFNNSTCVLWYFHVFLWFTVISYTTIEYKNDIYKIPTFNAPIDSTFNVTILRSVLWPNNMNFYNDFIIRETHDPRYEKSEKKETLTNITHHANKKTRRKYTRNLMEIRQHVKKRLRDTIIWSRCC